MQVGARRSGHTGQGGGGYMRCTWVDARRSGRVGQDVSQDVSQDEARGLGRGGGGHMRVRTRRSGHAGRGGGRHIRCAWVETRRSGCVG